MFPNLKPSTTTISLRLPETLLSDLRALANAQDVPYQSLLKVYLADRVVTERRRAESGSNKRLQPPGPKTPTKRAAPKRRARG